MYNKNVNIGAVIGTKVSWMENKKVLTTGEVRGVIGLVVASHLIERCHEVNKTLYGRWDVIKLGGGLR